MLPAERIPLIKRLAARLAGESEEEMRFIFVQFQIEPDFRYFPDRFEFDALTSATRSIERVPDEVLAALEEYFFGHSSSASASRRTDGAEGLWAGGGLRLFVSHTSAHKVDVNALSFALRYEGVVPFVAHDDIEPTQEWQDTIESALYTCDALLAYLTPDFAASKWTDQEVGFCLARDVLIVPVRVGADPHGFIAKYQGLQGMGKDISDLAGEIADLLVSNPRTSSIMAPGAVAAFARVGSWNAGRKHYARIMRVPQSLWTPGMIEEARNGIANNNQVSECGIANQGFVKDILPPYLDAIEASLS